jgi:hypothetical protein
LLETQYFSVLWGRKTKGIALGVRAAIERRIAHLKQDYRMGRNFLKRDQGDVINLLMAATAWNLRLWIRSLSMRFALLHGLMWMLIDGKKAIQALQRGKNLSEGLTLVRLMQQFFTISASGTGQFWRLGLGF